MQPYRDGEPFGELTQVGFDEMATKMKELFESGADEVRVYQNVVGTIVTDKEGVDVYNNREGRRALKFKNKKRRKKA